MFKLFGSKGKENYFLEFDDASGNTSAKSEQSPVPAKVETSEPITEEAVRAVDEAVKPVKEAPVATKPADSARSPEESAKPANKKKAKTKKAKAKKAETPTPATAPVVPAQPAPKKEPEPVVLFAPNYLMPTPTSTRRRPSANMSGFLDMARQMKRR